jgi:hypothetical protein
MAESLAHKPTVHVDAGPDGRVLVADSLSFFEHEPWLNDVAVGASFAGTSTTAITTARRKLGSIHGLTRRGATQDRRASCGWPGPPRERRASGSSSVRATA